MSGRSGGDHWPAPAATAGRLSTHISRATLHRLMKQLRERVRLASGRPASLNNRQNVHLRRRPSARNWTVPSFRRYTRTTLWCAGGGWMSRAGGQVAVARRSNNNCLSDGGDGAEDLSPRSTQSAGLSVCMSTPWRTPTAVTIDQLHYHFITGASTTNGT